jgi:nardilysin
MAPRTASAPAPASVVGPPLVTSPEDKREYRRVVLPNGLVALLVHDPDMTAAAGPGGPDGVDGAHQGQADDGSDMMEEDEEEEGDEEEGDEEGEEEEEDEEMDAEHETGHDAAPSKKAAIALAVSVGGFSDPEQAQGLSHFLEVRPGKVPLSTRQIWPLALLTPLRLHSHTAHGVHGQRGVPGRERV